MDDHLEAAGLVSRLEALRGMYRNMINRKIGTNVVESESMRLIKERLTGPTGHRLLEMDLERVSKRCWTTV